MTVDVITSFVLYNVPFLNFVKQVGSVLMDISGRYTMIISWQFVSILHVPTLIQSYVGSRASYSSLCVHRGHLSMVRYVNVDTP